MLWRVESGRIEIGGDATGLLDDPLLLRARGLGDAADTSPLWRARMRDDDARVWHASAASPADLAGAWAPAKATTGPLAALHSLRPVQVDVRVEPGDGRAARRTVTRALVGEGVRMRRWREPALVATLALPAGAPCATIVIDATAGPEAAAVAALAAPLLASRGVLALVVPPARERAPAAEALRLASQRLAAVPGAAAEAEIPVLRALDPVVLPPGIPARDEDAAARAGAWDALLARLGAQPRALALA